MQVDGLAINNDYLDLYSENLDNIYAKYAITLHNSNTVIGIIEYRKKIEFYGDIGYAILEEYQGNGYAYQALCLLLKYLYSNGINSIKLRAATSNKASIRTIEKLQENGLLLTKTQLDEYEGFSSNSYIYVLEKDKVNNLLKTFYTKHL